VQGLLIKFYTGHKGLCTHARAHVCVCVCVCVDNIKTYKIMCEENLGKGKTVLSKTSSFVL